MSPSFPYTYAVVLMASTAWWWIGNISRPGTENEGTGQGKTAEMGRQPRKAVYAYLRSKYESCSSLLGVKLRRGVFGIFFGWGNLLLFVHL